MGGLAIASDNDPRFQPFPEAMASPPIETGYYDHFVPLTEEDCRGIKTEYDRLLQTDKYKELKLE